MSLLPPDTIQVKRKRGVDDGPVDFLRVEGNKRFRSTSGDANWVYQRKQVDVEHADHPALPSLPVIQPTQDGEENRPIKSLRRPTAPAAVTAAAKADSKVDSAAAPASVVPAPANDRVRRFHLSKLDSPIPAAATTARSKKRGAPAVFVERSAKKQKESTEPRVPASQDALPADSLAVRPSTPTSTERMTEATTAAQPPIQTKYKRPGTKALAANKDAADATAAKPKLPPSLLNREGIDMDELARDMEAYTLSHITNNLDRIDQDGAISRARAAAAMASPGPARKSRFKPKAPATRFAERHPEYVAERERAKAAAADLVMNDNDGNGDSTDEDDYVLETYERVPASRLRDQAVPPHRVGLLVFDTEPERIDFFYGNEDESSDEFPEDDEDENAENYYTADYPDEDLDWDDQFDRNPYRYRAGNASDGEDEDELGLGGDGWDKIGDEAKDMDF